MKRILALLACGFVTVAAAGKPIQPSANTATLTVREIHYAAHLADDEARVTLDVEADASGDSSLKILEGDIAVLPAKLPDSLKIVRDKNTYRLIAPHAGHFKFTLEIVAKIQRAEPWNQISFTGPAATIASVTAQAAGTNTEVQLLTGTVLENFKTNNVSSVRGFLGAEQTVALRWQGKVAEVARKALLTVDSSIAAQVTPTVVKYTSKFHFDIVQGAAAQLTLALPAAQALTKLEGDQIRDWHLAADGARQKLTVEFIKPLESAYELTLYSEQAVENTKTISALNPPQPLDTERESGSLSIFAEDTLVEVVTLDGLRQVNAPDSAIAAYRFNARPFALALKLKPVEPVVSVADRVSARLEETRLLLTHSLALNVEKAGIYSLELTPQAGFAVADVRGDGIDDWKFTNGKLLLNFSARVLGARKLDVQLEQALKNFPDRISVAPLRVTGAAKETAAIGAASAPGIRLKTADVAGAREISVNQLSNHTDEILAFTADQPDWTVAIGSEKLSARVVADVFNLVTIGDGVVGGSATIRYGLVNQGVQEFKVRVPAQCKNVEFTGPNIRRKEVSGDTWIIGLQDKVWGGYTLVVTYDFQFDAKGATLPVAGVHAVEVERETGSIAITTAAGLQLKPKISGDTLRRVDEVELSAADRSLITRAVILAYQYTGDQYDLSVDAQRFAEEPVLAAVADRTQITSVLTEAGEMLTQASFMVKNNEKQFQRFQLPSDARLWGCYVNGQPAKPERDGDWVLVSLPHDLNRDQAFAVDIMYAQTNGALASTFGKTLAFTAPVTDVPNTYAEWQLFVPPTLRLSDFGGSMSVTEGTTYELFDAWKKFLSFYGEVLREMGTGIVAFICLAMLVFGLVIFAAKRGAGGLIELLVIVAILAILGAMMLPALSSAKRKAQKISSVNNLKQIGLACRIWSGDNGDRLPMSFEQMTNELGTEKITYDPATGQRYTYLGGGMSLDSLQPDSVIAYSQPDQRGGSAVLYADGSVATVTAQQFGELSQRGFVHVAGSQSLAERQREAVMQGQIAAAPAVAAPAAVGGETHFYHNGPATAAISAPTVNGALIETPMAAGIRSIRIELPQTGTPFLFTKVLNVHGEPLSIRAKMIPLHMFQTIQMCWQTAAFLFGLAVWWINWRRVQRNTFVLALALALILGSVGSLLIQWRALHDALIVGFPVVLVAVIAVLVWKFWPRTRKTESCETPVEPPHSDAGIPPVMAALAVVASLALAGANYATAAEIGNRQSAIGNASLVSVTYTGTINDRVALLDVTLQFSSVTPSETVTLFGDDVAVQEFTAKNGKAELIRNGNQLTARFAAKGDVTLQIKLLVKVAGDVTKRRLAFAVPAALSSRATLALAEAGADVDFPAAVSLKRTVEKEQTQIVAVLGATDHVELLWTPRVKRTEEIAATVFCRNAALVTFGGGVLNVRATLDYQITQGELRQARVQIPAGQKVLRVEGRDIRTWEIKAVSADEQTLVVDLMKGIPLGWRLTVETEKALDALPTSAAVEIPHALDVKRENGLLALQSAEELGLSVESSTGLERVDAEEFARAGAEKVSKPASVFRFADRKFSLHAHAEPFQPEIEAVVKNNFRVGAEQLALAAKVDYVIKRAGVFSLKLALPDGYHVERVSGNNILQYAETGASVSDPARLSTTPTSSELSRAGSEIGAPRVLEITLKERTSGTYSLTVELSRQFKTLPKTIAIAGVHPLGAVKLTGFVGVASEPGVAVKTDTFDGLTEIPVAALPMENDPAFRGVIAFKHISVAPGLKPAWTLSVAAEPVAAWVRAEIVNTFTIAETLVNGRAQIRYDIANAPVKELRVRVPAEFRNVEITGANIRSREQDGQLWRVELQNPTRGDYQLVVTWEQPRAAATRTLELVGVTAEGVERESGLLAIVAKTPLSVSESAATDLQRVDTGDFPDWAGTPDSTTTLAYRYARPGYKLALDVRRFDDAAVLEALVDNAKLTSVIAEDGQMMTEMSLTVRNNGRQFLEITLPAAAKVWSAFVGGQAVRPSVRDGKLLLPIESSGDGDSALAVEVTYVGTNAFPHNKGTVGFVSPTLDVPLKNARWDVYLPPDYDYQQFQGSMSRERLGAVETSSSFSLLDYSRMEQSGKASAKLDWQRQVTEARRQLAGGNVRVATENFNRAKGGFADKDTDATVKKLEDDLKTAQASNLINAQNEFTFRNSGATATDDRDGQKVMLGLNYDSSVAQQQWTKLEQAQDIVTAKVQPLRVNLPLRGQHLAFSQVLQTEGGRPMTIQMFAASSKAVNWPARIGRVVAAFLILWLGVAMVSRATRRTQAI